MRLDFMPMPRAASADSQNTDTASSTDSSKVSEHLTKGENGYEIGEIISLDQAEKTGTFHLVTVDDEKYLVDHTGKIILKIDPSPLMKYPVAMPSQTGISEGPPPSLFHMPSPESRPLKLRIKPGTLEFSQAVQEADFIVKYFLSGMKRLFRLLTPRFENFLENNHTPYIKYLQVGEDPLASIKAYLIREFFSNTIFQERGMEILEFLTTFIAFNADGSTNHDRNLADDEQRTLVTSFLEFIRQLGNTPAQRLIFEKTYLSFINQDYEWMKSEGGVGYYINASLLKALKAQRDFLVNEKNRFYMETVLRNMIRALTDFFLDNMLSFLKALTVLRLIANSTKEERGRDENERENLLYLIIVFRPPWYQQKFARSHPCP